MEKSKFKDLLVDLYTIYNPANIQYVDDLVERYSRLEFDAVQNIFIKYNRKDTPYYNEEFGTDKYILNLIKEYNSGLQSLKDIELKIPANTIVEPVDQKIKEEDDLKKFENIQKEVTSEVKGEIEKKMKSIEEEFAKKEQSFKTTLDTLFKDFEQKTNTIKEDKDNVTIRIFSTSSNSELDMPNKKIIAGLGKGGRLIIKDENNKTIGMKIVDIIYDGISELDGKPLVEVFLEKE
jgi:hypothetical protein